MSIKNLVVNGGFETGSLNPWIALNAAITTISTHSGFYAAVLEGGAVNAVLAQDVPVEAGESYELIVSLAKAGAEPNPLVMVTISYYDPASHGPDLRGSFAKRSR
jgi:hypothetical protein